MTTTERDVLRFLAAAVALSVAGCVDDGGEVDDASPVATTAEEHKSGTIFLDQGWDAATRAAFYQTTQGSRMLPYAWFLHLEQADSKHLLRDAKNMREMGFLVDGPTATNPDGLPVGFARDVDFANGDAMGLTCAACHTGELVHRGKTVRIDGGQSHGDLEQLQGGILGSLNATLASNKKFARFVAAVGAADASALRAEMQAKRDWWASRIQRSAGQTPHGPTRTDAFTIIGNEVLCVMLGVPENCVQGNAVAPTEFPFLWGTPDFEWAQYNSSVHSPLGRNVGEVTGVFAEASLDAAGVDSSANLENLHALETWLKSLQAPAWPEHVLGKIDQDLAAEGEVLYAANCASCHAEVAPRSAPNAFGRTFAAMNFSTPLAALGTDPTAAMSFATRRAFPGPWAGIPAVAAQIGPDGKVPAVTLLSVSGSMIIQRFFAVNGFTTPQIYDYLDYRESRTPSVPQITTYKARPLDGVALTAPYLHNGSVPSLYELLLPPVERVAQFYVGDKSYDPVDVGYSTRRVKGAVLLDTTQTGNGNGGHVYGTQLTDDERYALIEYIKTL